VESRWSREAEWPGTPENVALAREFVALHLEEHLLPDLVEGAKLVASELATNAVRHAGTSFVVSIERVDEHVTISVRDGSPKLPVVVAPVPLASGGHGLMLVEALSLNWGVTVSADAGKSVWARFETTALDPR
jgi:anti-sigma regulatory factor (Ser/Thr protein kinase)